MKRKLYATLLCLMLVLSSCFAGGCNANGNAKLSTPKALVQLSITPAIEMIVDTEGKVLSVNATNNEGNFILTKEQFAGKSLEKATETFLKANYEYGFISTNTEIDFTIGISGQDASATFDNLSSKALAYLNEKELKLVSVEFASINKKALENRAYATNAHISLPEIQSYSEVKILELINDSINEVEVLKLKTEEIKTLYFNSKAYAILLTKFQTCYKLVQNESDSNIAIFSQGIDAFNASASMYSRDYADSFLDPISRYQTAVNNLVTITSSVLSARKTNTLTPALLENLENARLALESATENASMFADQYKKEADSIASQLNEIFGQLTILGSYDQAKIDSAIATTANNYLDTFISLFGSSNPTEINYIQVTPWDNLG